jgi:hypothetical protein
LDGFLRTLEMRNAEGIYFPMIQSM